MIGYLEGKLLKKEADRILLLAGQVGYEVLLPAFVMETVNAKAIGDRLSFYIFYQQTERQPKPVLIGFNLEAEKEFFQYFISVEDIGPIKAVKALTLPIRDIARAIEAKDINRLKQLKGIGNRTAQKVIATLSGRVTKFALIREEDAVDLAPVGDFAQQVLDVMVTQLGHRQADARRMITEAMARNADIDSAEALFDEVYRGEKRA
jgi:Holliday junction DNA helicase RuvA